VDCCGDLQAGLKEGWALGNGEELSVNKTGRSRERCCTTGHNRAVKKGGKNIRKEQNKVNRN
jgi:hypothetical protein